MSLKNQIEEKLKQALKEKDKSTYSTLRLVVSAIKDVEIANRSKNKNNISDSEIMSILKKMIKQRNESSAVYKKAGRLELLKTEIDEIEVISLYLPKQMNNEETKNLCEEAIKLTGASSIKDMGKVMGQLKSNHSDSLDFSQVSLIIKELLK
tara:strand:- start:85 stop:540 length:456 start_codon:yes stop_codon:yes gene_type:complete